MTAEQAGALALMALMVLVLATVWMRRSAPPSLPRKAKTKKKAEPPPERETETYIDVRRVSGKVRASPIKKAQRMIEQDPLSALHIIRSWMNEPPPDRMIR